MSGPARVLGLDPGSAAFGWGVVERSGRALAAVAWGVIRPPAGAPLEVRLDAIFQALGEVIAEHKPGEAAVEGVFQAKNARSALVLGHARGVGLLAAARAGLTVHEYPPAAVKKALVGAGRAQKEQVRAMVGRLLGGVGQPPLDASDALAVAVCHLHSRGLKGALA